MCPEYGIINLNCNAERPSRSCTGILEWTEWLAVMVCFVLNALAVRRIVKAVQQQSEDGEAEMYRRRYVWEIGLLLQ